jgi:sugar phosphate isomerase/epimerase
MNTSQIAVNLYSVKDHLCTVEQAEETLRKLSGIGFRAVQLCMLPGLCDVRSVGTICDRLNIQVCGVHCGAVLDDPPAALKLAEELRCDLISFPYPEGRNLNDPGQILKLIAELQTAGKFLHRHGRILTYHNHHLELIRIDGRIVLEQIFAGTDARVVQAELDTYWIQYGGGDPVDWCHRLAGRLPQIHLKDYYVNPVNHVPESCALGCGNLNMSAVISAAEKSGCRWYILEQEHYRSDPFDELAEGYRFLESVAGHAVAT